MNRHNYVHGNQFIDELVLFEDSSGDYHYYLQDFRYSVYALVDNLGTIEERYRFDPYGKRTVVTDVGGIDEHYGFTGRYHDDSDDTDLIYFRERWMSGEMGRFVSRDPLEYFDGMNLYAGWFVPYGIDAYGLYDERYIGPIGKIKLEDLGFLNKPHPHGGKIYWAQLEKVDGEDQRGKVDPRTGNILINKNLKDNPELAVATIVHEAVAAWVKKITGVGDTNISGKQTTTQAISNLAELAMKPKAIIKYGKQFHQEGARGSKEYNKLYAFVKKCENKDSSVKGKSAEDYLDMRVSPLKLMPNYVRCYYRFECSDCFETKGFFKCYGQESRSVLRGKPEWTEPKWYGLTGLLNRAKGSKNKR